MCPDNLNSPMFSMASSATDVHACTNETHSLAHVHVLIPTLAAYISYK